MGGIGAQYRKALPDVHTSAAINWFNASRCQDVAHSSMSSMPFLAAVVPSRCLGVDR